jgi:hypothetical protein
VTAFSEASLGRFNFAARNGEPLIAMMTLTYPAAHPTDGREVKRHWDAMRRRLVRRSLKGLWILEFQERGAPHIHCFLTSRVDKDFAAQAWYEIVGSGDERHLAAGTQVKLVRELHAITSYARKAAQKAVPEGFGNVGRFWAAFGGYKVEPLAVLVDDAANVAPLTRIMRKLETVNRRGWGGSPRRDNGRYGMTSYDTGPAMLKLLESQATGMGEQPHGKGN